MTEITMERHRNERRHSTWVAEVPEGMLTDPAYFDDGGFPTAAFDQWMCDNGEETDVEYTDTDNDELYFAVIDERGDSA